MRTCAKKHLVLTTHYLVVFCVSDLLGSLPKVLEFDVAAFSFPSLFYLLSTWCL